MITVQSSQQCYLDPRCEIVFSSAEGAQGYSYFSGYYYPSPLRGHYLLCHRTGFDGRDISENDVGDIGYWDLDKKEFIFCAQTRAFNWQQGAMLQWLSDGRRFIFNQREENHFVSMIFDIGDGSMKKLLFPVYTVHPSEEFALAVNYEHLAFCRDGYNYKGVYHKRWDVFIDRQDGIYRVDLETGDVCLIIRTADVAAIQPRKDMDGCYHWLEHMIWNPSGTRFAFLHRWAPKDRSGAGHRTRLFTTDVSGHSLFMFPDVGFYSHMNWQGDDAFTVWSVIPTGKIPLALAPGSGLRRCLRPFFRRIKRFLPGGIVSVCDAYQAFISYKDISLDWRIIGKGLIVRNGHNTWTSDGRFMLIDTYADEHQYRHLALYDSYHKTLVTIGRFYSPYNESVYRCDLHPRFGKSEKQVIIDSAHAGQRHVYIIDISKILKR